VYLGLLCRSFGSVCDAFLCRFFFFSVVCFRCFDESRFCLVDFLLFSVCVLFFRFLFMIFFVGYLFNFFCFFSFFLVRCCLVFGSSCMLVGRVCFVFLTVVISWGFRVGLIVLF